MEGLAHQSQSVPGNNNSKKGHEENTHKSNWKNSDTTRRLMN